MNKFYVFLIVYVIAMVIAIVIILISYSTKKWRLPPSNCPDFWVNQSGTCYNTHKIRYNNNPLITSNNFDITTEDGIKNIKSLGITWDGITYGT